MANRKTLGGVIHAYQQYDPKRFPSPTQPGGPDLVSSAFEHMLMYGDHRELTPEELARAVRIDPSQIAGLGPSIDALLAILEERKRKILERYETGKVTKCAAKAYCQRRRTCIRRRISATDSSTPSPASKSASWSDCGTPLATTSRRSRAT